MAQPPLITAWYALIAEYWLFWSYHWRSQGPNYYGDHRLYERLYTARTAEIDRLAETISAIYGAAALNPAQAFQFVGPILERAEQAPGEFADKSIKMVHGVMSALNAGNASLRDSQHHMAVNNVLAGISDSQLEALYLLQQRAGGFPLPQAPTQTPSTRKVRRNSADATLEAFGDAFGSIEGLGINSNLGKIIGAGLLMAGLYRTLKK